MSPRAGRCKRWTKAPRRAKVLSGFRQCDRARRQVLAMEKKFRLSCRAAAVKAGSRSATSSGRGAGPVAKRCPETGQIGRHRLPIGHGRRRDLDVVLEAVSQPAPSAWPGWGRRHCRPASRRRAAASSLPPRATGSSRDDRESRRTAGRRGRPASARRWQSRPPAPPSTRPCRPAPWPATDDRGRCRDRAGRARRRSGAMAAFSWTSQGSSASCQTSIGPPMATIRSKAGDVGDGRAFVEFDGGDGVAGRRPECGEGTGGARRRDAGRQGCAWFSRS